ncbi:hypothetical protein AK812_SmicGene33931 [Symbiodinium microadriaticum]|uniref:Uncharacterized protein n=2 Tax=Symbiodinium TaxID=2949 RepID=A0A1Q9CQF9_SYMMI|nr:hypothetical protein AK812_SmicGene33931 [Symbiodinium microadriaticum]
MRLLCHESQNTADVGACNLTSLKSLKAWRSQPLGLFESEVPRVRQRLPSARFLCGPEDRGRCCKATSFISSSRALRLGEEGHIHRRGAGARVASFKEKSLEAVVQEKDKEAEEEELEEEAAAKQAPDPDKVNPECTQARKTGRPRCCLCINREAIWSQDGSCKHCVESGKGIRDCSEVDEGCRPGSVSWPLKYKEQEAAGSQPGQPARKPASKPASQPASQPARWRGTVKVEREKEMRHKQKLVRKQGCMVAPMVAKDGYMVAPMVAKEGYMVAPMVAKEGYIVAKEGYMVAKALSVLDREGVCAERFVTNITGEMNIPRARTPHEAKMLTKQAEQEAAQQAQAKEEIAKEQEEISKEMEKHGDEIAAETPA